ncbi:DivIVA domain-containing protein [Solwaraspora sp. WMMD791]|uniref:DivIVA domain-containing protein n=1 Tax=Solwaraspora sp. WMMD791 TaxID=3016086 RepID=UPI00249AC524|nr:DivIVA domain-containing protein [Solwaraspora sp. WMMD791]WFE26518.1 DivIVA domain-containing protein [Solwaraspora sp. WMMD791]
MDQFLLVLVAALTVAAVVFGVTVLVTGNDPGLTPVEPDGRAVPLPGTRPLLEQDITRVRFDTAVRGYRMAQVDQALRRAAYDIGYKDELIEVLQAEVAALREGRTEDAEVLRRARDAALVAAAEPATADNDLATTPPEQGSGDAAPPEPGSVAVPAEQGSVAVPAEQGSVAVPAGPADGTGSTAVRPGDGAAR